MKDRYVIKPADAPDVWGVWDMVRDAPVFGADALPKDRARDVARELNEFMALRPASFRIGRAAAINADAKWFWHGPDA
jgi:hypothetical protein